ncbi:G-type lectin S-receptor serine/threonine-protein kinase [Salix suchowensis]|nr:G-type lectin S-receptor serine/threonine-protein kinase [Salix suchowensis]
MARRGLNQRDLRATHSMLSAFFFSYAFFLCCFARDTITYPSVAIGFDRQESLVSAGKRFELGFFTPEESTISTIYLGIWYYKSNPRIVVWVANRNSPLPDDGAAFAITDDGNLQISHRNGTSYWSTELASTSSPAYREAKLLDSGNLVFRDTNNTLLTTILWESFADPTDTFLPGMKMRENLKLISWESKADPKEGKFSFQLDEGRFVILINDYIVHWADVESSDFFNSERMPDGMTNFLLNTTGSVQNPKLRNKTPPPSEYNNTRIRLDVEGELQYWNFDTNWSLQWFEPRDNCSVFNACGNFGSCNLNNMLACRCLPGFKPASPESWRNGSFSGGCSRSSAVCGKNDTFLRLKMMRVGQQNHKFKVENDTKCREECLNQCSCQAYSFVKGGVNKRRDRQPVINMCLIWTDVLQDLQEEYSYSGPDLFVRVSIADTDVDGHSGGSSRKKKPLSLIVGVTIASVIVLSSIFLYTCILMRKKAKRRESQQNTERNAALMYGTEKRVKNFIDAEELNEEDKKGIDVPFFDLDSILAATDYFSEENKLGRGGFGPVYKGKFPGGQEIAIKRLSSVSGQGLEEFKSEVILIARLQHRNLVRLVGYCIEGVEKILLYEYMPNKSLDSFIFDRAPGILLNWETRFDIILGVARGLLYLHQDSRLRIIHRDMKTSNILLDAEMNPKISDFGLARMFEGKQTEGSTDRVVGTYGYMAPEYALDGLFSVKSDVFSFGVVVIEILSGRRNGGYFNSDEAQSLLVYAWRIWREDKALDLMDETLHESCNTNEFLRCLNAALLCVQDDPADRPTMSNVVVMLSSEAVNLPVPKEPAFFIRRGSSGTASTSSKQERGLSSTAFSSTKQETSIDTEVASDEGG